MTNNIDFLPLINETPAAIAQVKGSPDYPDINGVVQFYGANNGVIVAARVTGLPKGDGECFKPIFAMHIHSGDSCSGNETGYFADAMSHYNPDNCPHPYHAGDMPPLFGCDGFAFLAFLTDRFTVTDIIEKTVIIHLNPDDFTTQPAGNSGEKIACGVIKSN